MKYLCYDTALNGTYTLVQLLRNYTQYISLFAETEDETIWDAAPYLFVVEDNCFELKQDPFVKLDHSILLETQEPLIEVCRFLQYYIYQWPGSDRSFFRVWDARVLLRNLPQWEEKKRQQFFEFFSCFYTESEQLEYFLKWQAGKFYVLTAMQVLQSEVLPPIVLSQQNANNVVTINTPASASSLAQKPEESEQSEQSEQKESEKPPVRKRRFFIE